MATQTITEKDEGKRVVDSNGNKVGLVSGVRGGTAYVDPDPGIGDTILSKLGWDNIDDDDYPLNTSEIDRITDDEIRLKRNL